MIRINYNWPAESRNGKSDVRSCLHYEWEQVRDSVGYTPPLVSGNLDYTPILHDGNLYESLAKNKFLSRE